MYVFGVLVESRGEVVLALTIPSPVAHILFYSPTACIQQLQIYVGRGYHSWDADKTVLQPSLITSDIVLEGKASSLTSHLGSLLLVIPPSSPIHVLFDTSFTSAFEGICIFSNLVGGSLFLSNAQWCR